MKSRTCSIGLCGSDIFYELCILVTIHVRQHGARSETNSVLQEVIWVQDESASVQVYVLNPCLVPIPRQMDQYLILTAACDHLLVAADGTLVNGRTSQPFVAKSFQVQVPAGLNLQHRSVADFASKGCTTLKLRPREAGIARLKVQLSL